MAVDALERLAARGANLDIEDDEGNTPASLAALHGSKKLVAILAARGADLNVKDGEGLTPCASAAREGVVRGIEALLRAGAECFPDGVVAAASRGRLTALKKLVRSGPRPDPKGYSKSLTDFDCSPQRLPPPVWLAADGPPTPRGL